MRLQSSHLHSLPSHTKPTKYLKKTNTSTPTPDSQIPNHKPNTVMKKLSFSLLAAALATGLASATTAYTTPVGYTTQPLNANQFNLLGLTLQNPVVVAGNLEDVSGAVLTDSDIADFAAVLPAGSTYIIEITSGEALGTSQDFVTRSGSTVTLPSAVAGLAATDTYQIRIAPTIEQIFNTDGSVLQRGLTSATADIIYIPNGTGGYNQYWTNNAGSIRNFVGGTAAPNIPVVYMDGVLIQKRATSSSLIVTGEVKTIGSTTVAVKGFNPIGTIYPVGTTLQNFGLDDDVQRGLTSATADIVYISNGSGGYTLYWLNNAGSWRNFVGGAAAAPDIPLSSAIFIERKPVSSLALDLTPPSSYSSL
jgi:hypothetical protein